MPGSFDRSRQGALVPCTDTGLAPGSNFAIICDKAAQYIRLFIINL